VLPEGERGHQHLVELHSQHLGQQLLAAISSNQQQSAAISNNNRQRQLVAAIGSSNQQQQLVAAISSSDWQRQLAGNRQQKPMRSAQQPASPKNAATSSKRRYTNCTSTRIVRMLGTNGNSK
jgi:hypothetical protein